MLTGPAASEINQLYACGPAASEINQLYACRAGTKFRATLFGVNIKEAVHQTNYHYIRQTFAKTEPAPSEEPPPISAKRKRGL